MLLTKKFNIKQKPKIITKNPKGNNKSDIQETLNLLKFADKSITKKILFKFNGIFLLLSKNIFFIKKISRQLV